MNELTSRTANFTKRNNESQNLMKKSANGAFDAGFTSVSSSETRCIQGPILTLPTEYVFKNKTNVSASARQTGELAAWLQEIDDEMEDSRYLPNQTELNAAQENELRQELLKYYQTSLIIGMLKQSDAPISIESRALLSMYKHEGELPLGLDHIRNVDISYHERIAIGKYLETKIIEQVRPFVEKAKRYSGGKLEELSASQFQEQYRNLQLDRERRELTDKLAQLKSRKLQLMKACADIRTGPFQRNNVELKHAEARSTQAKAELLQKLVSNEILNCTPHTVKAINEVSANINTLLGNGK